MSAGEKNIYRFEGFELDPDERRLIGSGRPITLTPKVFDTLVLLVQRAGHVVSKEELIHAIWPRGFVDDSNLTKHIWLIRGVLGEKDRSVRFIETVPKAGYRFVAPVTTRRADAAAQPSDPVLPNSLVSIEPAPPPERVFHDPSRAPVVDPRRAVLGLVAAVVLALLVGWRLWQKPAVYASPAGRSVALMGFSNLSRSPKDAWIAPALTEMLSAELNASADLHVVPDELVRTASAELTPPAASGYSLQTLNRLARRLETDYVVSGSYLVSDASENAPLRVEMVVQDTRTGAILAAPTLQSGVAQLTSLVKDAGVALRDKLSRASPDQQTLGMVANAQPPTVEVARRIGFALEALQNYDAARARDELLEAVAEAPGYPLAYAHLARAWSALGYRDKAVAAAEQAARHAVHLAPEQRLQADAMVAVARADWTHAVEAWQSLARLKPLNPEYRLQTIDAEINAGQADKSRVSLKELRSLPGIASDPRIELAAARIARALDDSRSEAEHAALALDQAQAREAPGLVADAHIQLAHARARLGQLTEARDSLQTAASGYRAIRNPRGEAQAHLASGALYATEHNAQAAREEYQRAMSLYQSIGDQAGIASVYREICDMLWQAGDRDGARTAAQESLQLAREIGDLHLQSWTLRALATIASDDAASDEVIDEYRQVLALTQKSGDLGGHVWSLATLADIQRLRGALSEAQETCARANTEAAKLSDPQFAIYSGFTCALVEIDRGDAQHARAALDEVLQQATATKNPVYADNARMTLAQLDMDEQRWAAARDELRTASRGFAADDVETGEADTMAMLARCEQALGEQPQSEEAAARARKLRESITSRQEVYLVDIALAQLEARRTGADIDKLLDLANDAERRHFVAWSLEARLAAWEILRAQGANDSAQTLRTQLEQAARRDGFGRILQHLRTP